MFGRKIAVAFGAAAVLIGAGSATAFAASPPGNTGDAVASVVVEQSLTATGFPTSINFGSAGAGTVTATETPYTVFSTDTNGYTLSVSPYAIENLGGCFAMVQGFAYTPGSNVAPSITGVNPSSAAVIPLTDMSVKIGPATASQAFPDGGTFGGAGTATPTLCTGNGAALTASTTQASATGGDTYTDTWSLTIPASLTVPASGTPMGMAYQYTAIAN